MAEALTYTSLITDIPAYAERTDAKFTAQIPRFVMLAENRIASEVRGLGLINSATDNLVIGVSGSALAKPSRWRETASLTIGKGSGFNSRKSLKQRSYEYCRYYWPDPTQTSEPVYYADWDYGHWLVSPSPDLAYPFELIYFERPAPLDTTTTTNWTTQFAPQLLLFACLLEASGFVKNSERVSGWQSNYDRCVKQVEFESKRRLSDRTNTNPNP